MKEHYPDKLYCDKHDDSTEFIQAMEDTAAYQHLAERGIHHSEFSDHFEEMNRHDYYVQQYRNGYGDYEVMLIVSAIYTLKFIKGTEI